MKLKRCISGHIYNEAIHSKCPYCSEDETTNKVLEVAENTVIYVDETDKLLVGWLVCILGPEKGKDYKIHTERNFIGRSDSMEIVIKLDKKIEYENHCSIAYNPKQRIFVITPGSSNSLIYVNNKAIYESKQINNFDVIEIGSSRFIFTEFCGNHFDWDSSI